MFHTSIHHLLFSSRKRFLPVYLGKFKPRLCTGAQMGRALHANVVRNFIEGLLPSARRSPDGHRLPAQHRSFLMQSFDKLMWCEDARPLIDILHWWLLSKKIYFIHSAAVGTEYGAALLVGAGGNGKSTTALTCLDAGLLYAGDDFCLVDKHNGTPRVFGTYSSAKLHPWSLDKLPGLSAMVSPLPCINDGDDSKKMLFFDHSYTKQLVRELPIRVVLLPQVGDCATSFLTPVSHKTVLNALQLIFQLQFPIQPYCRPRELTHHLLIRLTQQKSSIILMLARNAAS